MKFQVKYFTFVRDATKEKEAVFEFEGRDQITLKDLVIRMFDKYGMGLADVFFRKVMKEKVELFLKNKLELDITEIKFTINGRLYAYKKDLVIKDGDSLAIFPPFAGG